MNNPNKSYNYKQIASLLNLKELGERQLVNTILYELSDANLLVEIYRGKFKLKSKTGFIEGIVELTTKGYAWVKSIDIQEEVFISQSNLHHALHGDKVKVYLYARKKNFHQEGEVVEIIERSKNKFVGTVELSSQFAFLVPEGRNMPYDIYIPLNALNGAKNGQKAVAIISEWPRKAKNPIGEIIDVLGYAGENETEMHAILAEFDLPYSFTVEVNNAAETISEKITKNDIKSRRDFRKVPTFTIDPADAKDFDDALSIQKTDNGLWEIGIHIADVTYYVEQGSILDKEALERATSVYLVDRVVPMLPEKLSNNICSLRPNEDKLCFSAVVEMDDNATIKNTWFGRTIIHSDRRFTYDEAQKIIENQKGDMSEQIIVLDKLAKILRKNRFKKGAFDFERQEVKFNLDKQGKPLGVYFKEMKDSNHLIEEFMLLANRLVAEFVGKKSKKSEIKPFVYRIHDRPEPDKLIQFSDFIRKFGYKINTDNEKAISKSMNKLLNEVKGKKEQNLIENLAIRSMAKAEYSTDNIGHYGLGFSHYTHFTSPIRRYPDMMVHRLLATYLNGGNFKDVNKLEKWCEHSSEMERRAAEAERASIKYKQVEFMKDKIGQVFDGIISGVAEWGIYVEIIENKCEGLIPIRDLQDDYYIFDEDNFCIFGKRNHKKFQLGDEIKVEVISANLTKKQLDYRLIEQ
ncbi:MAG: ribonuclease R [Marinilabiliales bacterium]